MAKALKQVLGHPEDYPASACTQVARPYDAREVVGGIYSELLQQWQQKNISSTKYEQNEMQKA